MAGSSKPKDTTKGVSCKQVFANTGPETLIAQSSNHPRDTATTSTDDGLNECGIAIQVNILWVCVCVCTLVDACVFMEDRGQHKGSPSVTTILRQFPAEPGGRPIS